ncbi:MAG: hypothetical protein AB7F65_02310 [Dehalococcoidia bacterium]
MYQVTELQIFGLDLAQRADTIVFALIALLAAVILVVTYLVGEVFDVASDIGNFEDPSAGLLNVQTVSAFLAGFGATGWLLAGYFDVPSLAAAGGGIAGGLPMGGVVFWMTRQFVKNEVSTSFTLDDLVGVEAIVTLAVPASGAGRVQFSRAGGTHTAVARSASGEPIREGQVVVVRRVVGGTLLVDAATAAGESR